MYKNRFEDDLEGAIESGWLLNDIVFFFTEGMVESWSKEHTSVDLENQTVSCDDKLVHFDHYIAGGYEAPRLPSIVRHHADGTSHIHQYNYMRNYLGVVPSGLKNIYYVGYTRPYTGGLANIVEMQCLLAHKMVSDAGFRDGLTANLQERLDAYNAYHYPYKHLRSSLDHLVHFGHYSGQVAREIGIHRTLRDAWSWNPLRAYINLRFELLHPNNPVKFRMKGEYAVEGAEALARRISRRNDHWAIMNAFFLSSVWDKLGALLFVALAYLAAGIRPFLEGDIGTSAFAACTVLFMGLLALLRKRSYLLNVITWSTPLPLLGPKASLQPIALAYAAYTGDWRVCAGVFGTIFALAFLARQVHVPPVSGRYLFGDCKFKHRYRGFWKEYQAAYDRVRARRKAAMATTAK